MTQIEHEIREYSDIRNPIDGWLVSGLDNWRQSGAYVSLLEFGVPRIIVSPSEPSRDGGKTSAVVIITGMHLEETSGPRFVLDPILTAGLAKGGDAIIIYPVVNQHGLAYPTTVADHLLRHDKHGINYNDGWGLNDASRKTSEVRVIENDLLSLMGQYAYKIGAVLHEDSTMPKQGYAFLNNVLKHVRDRFAQNFIDYWGNSNLPLESEQFENNFIVVDDHDEGTCEEWLAYRLNMPVFSIEAPFGLSIEHRVAFQRTALFSAYAAI